MCMFRTPLSLVGLLLTCTQGAFFMSATQSSNAKFDLILESLERQFGGPTILLTRSQVRALLQISEATDNRMYYAREYPQTVRIRGDERILLADLAAFLVSRPDGRELNRPKPYTRTPKPTSTPTFA